MAERATGRDRLREKPEQIADEIRRLIVEGELSEGDSLGREPDLIDRFGVSRPSLREALRILEAEGLISVVRGVLGGVVVHEPGKQITARTAAMVLQARNVSLADVYEARRMLELTAVRAVASSRGRKGAVAELGELIADQEEVIDDPDAFGRANALFHERLVALAGNQTLSIVAEMLNEILARAVTALSRVDTGDEETSARRRGIRSQRRLVSFIDAGDAAGAEEHWQKHTSVVGRIILGQDGVPVIDSMHHY